MTTTQSPSDGRFCWYELMTSDPAEAQRFYSAVLPWGSQGWEGGEGDYTMLTVGDRPFAGLMAVPAEAKAAGAPPQWLVYIAVDDLDARFTQAKELGAAVVVEPTQIPGAGRFATLRDPQGGSFSLYQMNDGEDLDDTRGPGRITWRELATSDWEAAWAFYSALFGWERVALNAQGEGSTYLVFKDRGGASAGGMFTKPSVASGPPTWLCYGTVADLDAALETVIAAGGRVLEGPKEVPGGDRVAHIADPQGALFALHQAAP